MNSLTQLLSNVDEFQPRKVEELLPHCHIVPDTYMIYPTGGYHPFYGALNTLPRYQEKIWPYVKRIKFNRNFQNEELRNIQRKSLMRKEHHLSQLNPSPDTDYFAVSLQRNKRIQRFRKYRGQDKIYMELNNQPYSLHRLVALAFIPNLEKKPLVMHINDDTTNYLIENLKWGTHRENMKGKKKRRPGTMEQKYQNLVNRGIIKG